MELTIKELKDQLEVYDDDNVVLSFPDGLYIYKTGEDKRNYRCGVIYCSIGSQEDVKDFYKDL